MTHGQAFDSDETAFFSLALSIHFWSYTKCEFNVVCFIRIKYVLFVVVNNNLDVAYFYLLSDENNKFCLFYEVICSHSQAITSVRNDWCEQVCHRAGYNS